MERRAAQKDGKDLKWRNVITADQRSSGIAISMPTSLVMKKTVLSVIGIARNVEQRLLALSQRKPKMINRDRYWKCEYENLRRKKNKQINEMQHKQMVFMEKTWKLLKQLGMSESEIFAYYRKDLNETQ